MWLTLAPILTFWTAALGFHWLGLNSETHLTSTRNLVTPYQTVVRMLQIDALHVVTTLPMEWGWLVPPDRIYGVRWWYIVGGMLLMDTVEYFSHRVQHHIPVLYKYFHYGHHAMRESYSFGSFYNAFTEIMLTAPLIGFFFMQVFAFTFVEFQIVSSLAVLWTVMDHTAWFDDVWWLGRRNFHRIHHSVYTNCNFQQPFFTFWDRWLGTDYDSVMRRRRSKPTLSPLADETNLA